MNKREQDIIQKLREKTDDIKLPEKLAPENVQQQLEKNAQKKKINLWRIGGLAAACIAVIAGAAVYQNSHSYKDMAGVSEEKPEKISESKTVVSAGDYEEVYSYLESYKKEMERQRSTEQKMMEQETGSGGEVAVESVEDTAVMDMADGGATAEAGVSAKNSSDYSETNVRQEGVDEGDIVKTDGTCLYVLKDNRNEIAIVDIRENDMKKVQSIDMEGGEEIQEFYLNSDKKRLVVICSGMKENALLDEAYQYPESYRDQSYTEAITYNIEDPTAPKEEGRIRQSGYYQSSRMVNGYLYLFSNYNVSIDAIERKNVETYVPLVNDSVISEKNICLPMVSSADMYMVVTAVDTDKPGEITDSKAVLSGGGQLYVSNENIYYYETIWSYYMNYEDERTTIRSISYKDGILEAKAQGTIDGYINDSFSIDEYNGYLRVVVTDGDTNAVYVLDRELEIAGSIKNLAKDERVYSARLIGNTGYFVTFRETDPLFSVDFSDPENPEIIGTLKIPGFSDYLHPYGDGKLLGIGMNVDEETMITDGVKISMFDISDPSDVKEEDTFVLRNVYYTDVSYDYKAALVDVEKNIIGFAGETEGGQKYYVFEYDKDNGFLSRMEEEINGNSMQSARGVYIGETLYVVQGNIIEAYSMKEYTKVDDIIL